MKESAIDRLLEAQPGRDYLGEIQKVHILLVDDDPNVLKLCERYLKEAPVAPEGIDVAYHTAIRGEQALEIAERLHADSEAVAAALLDIVLPGAWDGVEACRQLWNHDPEIQCILMTGAGAGVEEIIERRVPPDLLPKCDYLGKPFSRFSLVQHIRRSVHSWCSHRREELRRGENIKLVLQLGALIEEMGTDASGDEPGES